MNSPLLKKALSRRILPVAGLLLLALTLRTAPVVAADAATSFTAEELAQGERMYFDGVLPSGEPIQAYFAGDVPVLGTTFTCVSCHLRSGLGSEEGRVSTPPTNGRILYEKREPFFKGNVHVPSYHNYAVYFPVRPAYTDETLATLIAGGVDPTGRSVLTVMPRYEIDDHNMALLIAYLKTMADEHSPGVTKEQIQFATVIVEGTDPVAVASMIAPIQFSVDRKNALATAAAANDRVARMAYNMLGPDLLAKRFTLSRWILKGPSDTWRAQLEEYYRKEPVFALLGGISEGDWEPVHRFCEDNKLPDLFPIVDYPVISDTDWYTLYLSRGVRQEGEAAARYLRTMAELLQDKVVLQVYPDSRHGKALADGFRSIWNGRNRPAVTDVMLGAGETLTAKRLQKIVGQYQPSVLVLWDDATLLKALDGLPKKGGPKMVMVSGATLGDGLWTIPEKYRDLVYITYPQRFPHEEKRYELSLSRVLQGKPMAQFNKTIIKKSFITNEVLGKALMMMRSEYYRDFLLDTIGMMEDMYFPLYERVGFGPGQRYVAKGCFIVQLGKGKDPQLERRSEWVIH